MSKIRGKETEPESDIVLPKYHTMIFVNGFFGVAMKIIKLQNFQRLIRRVGKRY